MSEAKLAWSIVVGILQVYFLVRWPESSQCTDFGHYFNAQCGLTLTGHDVGAAYAVLTC